MLNSNSYTNNVNVTTFPLNISFFSIFLLIFRLFYNSDFFFFPLWFVPYDNLTIFSFIICRFVVRVIFCIFIKCRRWLCGWLLIAFLHFAILNVHLITEFFLCCAFHALHFTLYLIFHRFVYIFLFEQYTHFTV